MKRTVAGSIDIVNVQEIIVKYVLNVIDELLAHGAVGVHTAVKLDLLLGLRRVEEVAVHERKKVVHGAISYGISDAITDGNTDEVDV